MTVSSVSPISESWTGLTIANRRSGPRSMPTRAGAWRSASYSRKRSASVSVRAPSRATYERATRPPKYHAITSAASSPTSVSRTAARADELMPESVDDPQVDRRPGHHVAQLLLDVRERESAGEHALRPVVERHRDREDDRLCPQRAARDEHRPDSVAALKGGPEVVPIGDVHAVRGRREAREVPPVRRGQADREPVGVVLDDGPEDRVDRDGVGLADGPRLSQGVERGDVPRHEAVGGARRGAHECQASGFDTLAPGLGLLADDRDDPQALARERPRGGRHEVTLSAVARLLHGSFDGVVIERWLRSLL